MYWFLCYKVLPVYTLVRSRFSCPWFGRNLLQNCAVAESLLWNLTLHFKEIHLLLEEPFKKKEIKCKTLKLTKSFRLYKFTQNPVSFNPTLVARSSKTLAI